MALLFMDLEVAAPAHLIHARTQISLHIGYRFPPPRSNVVFVGLQGLLVAVVKLWPSCGVCQDIAGRPSAVKDYFARRRNYFSKSKFPHALGRWTLEAIRLNPAIRPMQKSRLISRWQPLLRLPLPAAL